MIKKETAHFIFKAGWILLLAYHIAEIKIPADINLVPFIHISQIPFIKYISLAVISLLIIPWREFKIVLSNSYDIRIILLTGLMLLITFIAAYLSDYKETSIRACARFTFYYLLLIIMIAGRNYFSDTASFVLKSFVYANVLVIAGSLLDFFVPSFHQTLVNNFGRPEAHHSIMKIGEAEVMRPMGFLTDSNLTAFSIAIALILILINNERFDKWFKYIFYASASIVFGMLASRASLIICIISIILFAAFKIVSRKEVISFSLFFIVFQMITPQTNSRILSFFDNTAIEAEYTTGRAVIWEAAWNLFLHKPVIGAGPAAFFEVSRDYMIPILERDSDINLTNPAETNYHQVDKLNPHNIFLAALSETGITGTCVFLLLLIVLALIYRKEKKYISLILLLCFLIVSSFSNFAPYYKYYLIMCIMFYIGSCNNFRITDNDKRCKHNINI